MSKRLLKCCPLLLLPLFSLPCSADCIPFTQAHQHIGSNRCITGKVLKVEEGTKGVTYLDFCDDYRLCPFTVVVFPSDLKHVGDVRQLKDKVVEIHGDIQQYDTRAEIILSRPSQLGGKSSMLPPLPKNYDVEKKGHYSAGTFNFPKSSKPKRPKQQPRVDIETGWPHGLFARRMVVRLAGREGRAKSGHSGAHV